MQMSHQSHIIKAEFGMLCDQGYYTSHVRGYFKDVKRYIVCIAIVIFYILVFSQNYSSNLNSIKLNSIIL